MKSDTGLSAEATVTVIMAIARALVEAANDFGEGNQIGGDVWVLATAALNAAAPYMASRVAETRQNTSEAGRGDG